MKTTITIQWKRQFDITEHCFRVSVDNQRSLLDSVCALATDPAIQIVRVDSPLWDDNYPLYRVWSHDYCETMGSLLSLDEACELRQRIIKETGCEADIYEV